MLAFLKALAAVERGAKVRFCDDGRARRTTMIVGIHYGDEALLNEIDNAHAAIKPGFAALGRTRVRVLSSVREHDLDKKSATYSIMTELLSEDKKTLLRELVA